MTIEEMKARKAELGFTNEAVSRLSGVPLGTVQKIFAGETKSPRYETVQKLTKVLEKPVNYYSVYESGDIDGSSQASETSALYEYGQQRSPFIKPQTMTDEFLNPPKKRIGIADGKFKMPPDELLFDDEITGMFDDL